MSQPNARPTATNTFVLSLVENEIRNRLRLCCESEVALERKQAEEHLAAAVKYVYENVQESKLIVGRSQKFSVSIDVYVQCAEAALQVRADVKKNEAIFPKINNMRTNMDRRTHPLF